MAHKGNSNVPVLMIAQRKLFHHAPFGLTSRIQLTVQYKKYTAYVLMQLWKEGEVKLLKMFVKSAMILVTYPNF